MNLTSWFGRSCVAVLLMASLAVAQDKTSSLSTPPRVLPGIQANGRVQLPTQWSLQPVGKQIALGDFPVNIAVHPEGEFAAVLHAGYGEHEVVIVELKTQKVVSRVTVPQSFYGLAFNHQGAELFVSGGEHEVVHRFAYKNGYLSDHSQLKVVDSKSTFVPSGLSVADEDRALYVAGGWGDQIARFNLQEPNASPRLYDLAKGDHPYAVLPGTDQDHVFVSLWGGASVISLNVTSGAIEHRWPTPSHPTEMILSPDRKHLFVACANSNSVVVIDLVENKSIEEISSALYPQALVGSTPNSIALSADGKALAIANADNNNLALFDVSQPGHARSLGFIPVGWYPTSVRFLADGRLLTANGKGLGSKSNRHGPRPGQETPASVREYIAGLFKGTLSVIEAPSPNEMKSYTEKAYACSPLLSDNGTRRENRSEGNPIPAVVGESSPIKYCLYIIKENRTYDQVFGDLPQGNGEASLCLFPATVTPNHHALASEFVLLDNFYVESEVSADGHEWSMAAYATDYTEKTWPLLYRGGQGKLKYPAEGSLPIAASSGGYIWDRCAEAGVSFRSYGEFITNPKPGVPVKARVKSLEGKFDPDFHGYDLDFPDVKRAERFIGELERFEREGDMPRLQILRLPNDHTQGTVPGKPTPTAMVADNDLALGRVIEAVSRSKFWSQTAIFVIEDDAQNGSDHVDAHRTVALVISPYTKRKFVDSSMYSTASMLRTMELILGLKPMSQFDAAALPMYHSFQATPDLTPYQHRPAGVDLSLRSQENAWGAKASLAMDFSREDAADDLLLNEVVWRSVRGAHSVMPPPVRASFVFALSEEDEEEEDDE